MIAGPDAPARRDPILAVGPAIDRDPASYRDPAGFVYRRDGTLYRQVNRTFAERWDDLLGSGLLHELQADDRLIDHEPAALALAAEPAVAHAVIRPREVDFVSYPYEWSFHMLRDAALLTLDVQETALSHGFMLRDASAFNVQFVGGRPILIDTLSLERVDPGRPWPAYRQFCEQLLAPLALMAYRDARCGLMLRDFLDGIPLDLAARLLPTRTRLRVGLASHIHLHARAQARFAGRLVPPDADQGRGRMSLLRHRALVDSLRRVVDGLRRDPGGTEWADYEDSRSHYGETGVRSKDELVRQFVAATTGPTVWDLGANTGRFSRIAADLRRRVVAWDVDPAATDRHYRTLREAGDSRILPLVLDLANPSPGLGWMHRERRLWLERADPDVVLALALVHHLAIGRNVGLPAIVELFARLGPELVVEWVPREDPMVQRLLASREDIFHDHTLDSFRAALERHFSIAEETPISGTNRTLLRCMRTGL